MRFTLVTGLVGLLALAGCSGGTGGNARVDDHIQVCTEQSEWARSGKVPTGEIAISCPDHGIGDYQ